MISKNQIKLIRSLEQKKNRLREGLFVAEGPKVVGDLLARYRPKMVVATEEWLTSEGRGVACETTAVSDDELRRVSFLQHPQQVLALFDMPATGAAGPDAALVDGQALTDGLALMLDGVQDPGNLGTIIRIADWFGVENVVCSADTADCYNPKVVQATMGSLARVNILYIELTEMLNRLPAGTPVYGTFLDGADIYSQNLSAGGLIVMGNEGRGISRAVASRINRRLLIPNYPPGRPTADSLNVAIATAIVCAEFRRRGAARP